MVRYVCGKFFRGGESGNEYKCSRGVLKTAGGYMCIITTLLDSKFSFLVISGTGPKDHVKRLGDL